MRASSLSATALFAIVSFSAGCGGIGAVGYEPRAATPPPRSKAEVVLYDVDCREPLNGMADCTYNGQAVAWRVIGAFHTPAKAIGKWGKYRSEVHSMGASKGCPAVAVRRSPPSSGMGEPIGAFCVDPSTVDAGGGQGGAGPGPGIGISGSATVTPPPAKKECNSTSDCPAGQKCARGTCE